MFDPNSDMHEVTVKVPHKQMGAFYAAVAALHGSTSAAALVADHKPAAPKAEKAAEPAPNAASTAAAPVAGDTASAASSDELDSAGWPWSAELHASTKGVTKEGLWRMKVGVARPDPKPGFPKTDAAPNGGTGTSEAGKASQAGATAATAAATSTGDDEEDEFAAFRAAADKANGSDAAAAANIPARKWTDADLGALCNQAAVKLGDPAPVRTLIAEFCPEGTVAHSRNIPEAERENFAKAVETKAGIEFAG
jgi:hypothetical protein